MPNFIYDHIHIKSPNPLKAAEFYIQIFGAEKVGGRTSPNYTSVELSIGGTLLIISPEQETHSKHFGFITDDIYGAVADMKAKGFKVLEGPSVGKSGNTFAFIEAPDKEVIQLSQKPK
jgi:lactoylglutathione lyase